MYLPKSNEATLRPIAWQSSLRSATVVEGTMKEDPGYLLEVRAKMKSDSGVDSRVRRCSKSM